MPIRTISGRGLLGRAIDGRALGLRVSGGGTPTFFIPQAPVLTWVTGTSVNPPTLSATFDDAVLWLPSDISGSNFDRIELQIDADAAFGSPDDFTNDIDAAEILAGSVDMSTAAQPGGVALYARARQVHYMGGTPHYGLWSSVETKTLVDITGGLATWFDGLPFEVIRNPSVPTSGSSIWFDGLPIGLV